MHNFLLTGLLISILKCTASESSVEYSPYGYHERVGIPKASWLMRAEVDSSLSRIVGGSQVTAVSAIPHQASIVVALSTGQSSICGGTLISATRVLTAAHCWWDGNSRAVQFTIVLGSLTIFSGGTRIVTNDVTTHPLWNNVDITNDLAMVKIRAVSFNNNIQAVSLPTQAEANQAFAGVSAVASGFGRTRDDQIGFPATTSLFQTTLNIITNAECQKSFKGISIHTSHLCTSGQGKVGTCDGDSGGPLTVLWNKKRILVGVVSFGLDDDCERGLPSVFTRVTAFLIWINANL